MIGCVGKDAELNEINGNQYACFDLAHSEKVRGEKRTTWVKVRKLDRDGVFAQWITRGIPVYVEGRPQVSAYVNKEGAPVAEMTIWADRLEFIAGTGQGENQPAYAQPAHMNQTTQPARQRAAHGGIPVNTAFERQVPQMEMEPDGDLPF